MDISLDIDESGNVEGGNGNNVVDLTNPEIVNLILSQLQYVPLPVEQDNQLELELDDQCVETTTTVEEGDQRMDTSTSSDHDHGYSTVNLDDILDKLTDHLQSSNQAPEGNIFHQLLYC